jgi:hypothetical protein
MKGWKYDSAKHAMAARGIKTQNLFSLRTSNGVRAQIFENRKEVMLQNNQDYVNSEQIKLNQMQSEWNDAIQKNNLDRAEYLAGEINKTEQQIDMVKGYYSNKSVNSESNKDAWWKTSNKEDLKSYVKRNTEGHEKNGLKKFEKGVKETIFHPEKDLDGEWKEYTSVADNKYYGPQGKSEKLSKDKIIRTEQRGAALVGRVVSQANVEPLIDKNEDRSFRDIMMDIEFGRRT